MTTLKMVISYIFLLASSNVWANDAHTNEQPNTITAITLAPHLTELVYSAGGNNNLKGVSAYSDYPTDALNKQVIGDAFHLNLELIKQINPDVVFYWQGGTPTQTVTQLKEMQLNLVAITIKSLSDIPQAINQIASVLNTQPSPLAATFNPALNALKNQTQQNQKQHQTALIQISDQPIYTVDGSHWMSEAIAVCGLTNVFKELPKQSAAVNLEAVILKKPEVIVRLKPLTSDHKIAQWESIPAIKNQHIAVLNPDHFTRPTLRTLSAIESLCAQVKTLN